MPELTIHRGGDTARVSFSGTPVLDEVLRMRLVSGHPCDQHVSQSSQISFSGRKRIAFSGTPCWTMCCGCGWSAGIHEISMFPSPAKHPFSEENHA